jgi:Phosphotransferase enzyme family
MTVDWRLFFPPGTRVVALPNWRRPRLYLPAQGFAGCWRASSFYPASRFRARIYRLLLRAKATTGLVGVRAARTDRWLLGEFVQDMLPQVVSAVVLVGTPGPAQKITAQLQDVEGRILGYLKYAEKEAAYSRIRREHRVLSVIPEGLGPKTLKYGTLANGRALLTTPISGRRLPATLPPAGGVVDFLRSFACSSPISVEAHPWVRSVRERSSERVELDTGFEALAGKHWPVVLQHGDFAPWNLLRRSESTVAAFDWEYGTLEGFPCLDLAYYVLQTSALIYRWAPTKAARYTAGYLTKQPRFGLSSAEARALTRLAAYDAYQNSLEDGQTRDGGLQPWRRAIWEGAA